MATPLERRNQQVWETLNAAGGGAKQALQLIARRMKKGEKGDHLFAMKAFILAQMPSAGMSPQSSPLTEALSLCEGLAFRSPPPKENDTIHLLEMTFLYLGKKAEIGKLHEHLYKSRIATPGRTKLVDEAGLKEWYNGCMRACDWAGMQKAAMMLQKDFPNNRNYYFWAVAACFIRVVACDDDQRASEDIYGKLATRMISKAAGEIPEEKAPGPIRSIRTAAELQLFYEIQNFTKTLDAELVKLLESPTTGFKSRLGADNYWEFWWQLVSAKLRLQEFKEANSECLNVISTGTVCSSDLIDGKSESGEPKSDKSDNPFSGVWKDDWKVWSGFVTSAIELGIQDPEDASFNKAISLFKEKMEANYSSRNALLAAIKFSSSCAAHPSLSSREEIPKLSTACFTFFQKQGKLSCCYDDLRPYVVQLGVQEKKDFLSSMTTHCKSKDLNMADLSTKELTNAVREWVTLLKFRFWLEIDDQKRLPSPETLSDFTQECLTVYNTSLKVDVDLLVTDMPIGDELLLLITKSLMCRYAFERQDTLPLKIAIILLEHLLSRSKHNFTALLLLVRLYSVIGALSCATVEYQRLSIKQIQNDSLSHHILTRLSTLLPFIIPSSAKLLNPTDIGDVGLHVPANPTDSLEMYDISLKLYKNANRTNPDMISLAFKNSAYGQIKDMVLFEKRVSTSISACQFEIERRRVQRFRGLQAEGSGALWDRALSTKLSDNRAFDLFGEDGWSTGCGMGPRLGVQWVKAFTLAESIMATLTAQSQGSASAADGQKSSSAASSSKSNGSDVHEGGHVPASRRLRTLLDEHGVYDFTEAERLALEIVFLIGDIQTESENRSGAKVKTLLADLKANFQTLKEGLQAPNTKDEGASISGAVVAGMSQISLVNNGKDVAPWYSLHLTYMLLETSKYVLQLCDFLEKSPMAKAIKPQIPKAQITDIRNLIGSTTKDTIQNSKAKAKQTISVTESDIDMVLNCEGLKLDAVSSFLKTTVGREKIENYIDKVARSMSYTWGAVAGVKIG